MGKMARSGLKKLSGRLIGVLSLASVTEKNQVDRKGVDVKIIA
jgi:hypothetical protein